MPFRRALPAILMLLFLPALLLPADPLIKRAHDAERAENEALAARIYRDWLHAYPGAPGSAGIFASYFHAERSFHALLEESRGFIATGRGRPGAGEQFLRIARLFGLAGLIEESRDAYLDAFAEGAPGSPLLSAALLSLQLNDTGALTQALSLAGGRPEQPLIAALAALQAGDSDTAGRRLKALAESTDDPDIAMKALWVLHRSALATGDSAAASLDARQLENRFAGSPEAVMTGGSPPGNAAAGDQLVRPFPSPWEILSLPVDPPEPVTAAAVASPAETAPASSGASSPQPPALYAIQAGSFQIRENAEYLAADLTRKGFSSTVAQDTFQGKERFRVLAGTGLSGDQARDLLARLTKAGYSGFLTAGSQLP